jgi:hypothetical protein
MSFCRLWFRLIGEYFGVPDNLMLLEGSCRPRKRPILAIKVANAAPAAPPAAPAAPPSSPRKRFKPSSLLFAAAGPGSLSARAIAATHQLMVPQQSLPSKQSRITLLGECSNFLKGCDFTKNKTPTREGYTPSWYSKSTPWLLLLSSSKRLHYNAGGASLAFVAGGTIKVCWIVSF